MTPSETADRIVRWPEEFASRYRAAGAWEDRVVGDIVHAQAQLRPEAVAACGLGWAMTYGELDDCSDRFAAALLGRGLAPGDRALVQLGNERETVIAYYALVKAGIVPVCAIPQHGERDMLALARQADPRAYFVQGDFRSQDLVALARRVADAVDGLDVVLVVRGRAGAGDDFEELVASVSADAARAALADVQLSPEDVVVFQLSGGTTGTPKIIPRLHHEYRYNARAWAQVNGWGPGTVVMHPIPLIHNAGIAAAMQPCHLSGGRLVLPASPDPEGVMRLIEREHVQVIPVLPPALVLRILEHPRRSDYDLSSLTHVVVGGQGLPLELAHAVEEELGIPCRQMFGMAEGMFLRTPDDAPEWVRKRTVGAPISPLDEVRILAPGSDEELATGAVGELCCRGPYTIRGYFDAPEHNARAFTADGFYRTGDLAQAHSVDGRTYYSVEGRIKDVINRGAEKINAGEVEEVILAHDAIDEVAVVAMPDRDLGERACAFVVPVEGCEPPMLAELVGFLLARGLARFKLPERLEVVDRLPLANIGKVDKKVLRDRMAETLRAESVVSVGQDRT